MVKRTKARYSPSTPVDPPTLYVMKGLPASGKTTYAKQLVSTNGKPVKRVNRDDLRKMLDNGVYSPENEELLVVLRDLMVRTMLMFGVDVVIDETNLKPDAMEPFKKLVDAYGAKMEVLHLNVPVEECIARDLLRPNSVGEEVIRKLLSVSEGAA
jgi:predicted kinase